jgi:hypothetical protein
MMGRYEISCRVLIKDQIISSDEPQIHSKAKTLKIPAIIKYIVNPLAAFALTAASLKLLIIVVLNLEGITQPPTAALNFFELERTMINSSSPCIAEFTFRLICNSEWLVKDADYLKSTLKSAFILILISVYSIVSCFIASLNDIDIFLLFSRFPKVTKISL